MFDFFTKINGTVFCTFIFVYEILHVYDYLLIAPG